jgi:hypothetical protein
MVTTTTTTGEKSTLAPEPESASASGKIGFWQVSDEHVN